MPYLTITITVESDVGAQPQQIFQKIKRVFLTEASVINVQKSGGDNPGTFTTVPSVNQSTTLNALILATDSPLQFKLNSVANNDGIVAMQAGGVLLAIGCAIGSGATTNATVNNLGGTATITGVQGGS